MTRFLAGLVFVLFASVATKADDAEDTAVKFIVKLKGKITRNEKQPGKPIVGVDLSAEKVNDAELKKLASLKNLTTLKLNHNDIGDKTLAELRKINLLHTLSDAEGEKGARPQNPAGVTRINLVFTKVTDEGLKELADFKNLVELGLNDTKVTDKGLKHLAKLTNLTTLGLPDKAMTDQSLAQLRKINLLHALAVTAAADGKRPHKAKDVTRIDLQKTLVTDEGLKELADLTNLTELHLFNTSVTDAGLKHIAKVTGLTTLTLFNTKVTDAQLMDLAPLKNLIRLSLPDGAITDQCLAKLRKINLLYSLENAKAVGGARPKKPGDVIELDLSETKVSDQGMKELTSFVNLTKLYLPSSVTNKGLEEIKKALPKCKIEKAED